MIVALLQARMTSCRLPGKVLMPILGRPMLLRQIERVQKSTLIDKLVIVTSTDASDDAIKKLCDMNNLACYRGALDDVLDRYYRAACYYRADIIVRLTGDCPLSDPEVIDKVVRVYLDSDCDYASNTLNPQYPDGYDVEVFNSDVLYRAWVSATKKNDREHVTQYIVKNPDLFKLKNIDSEFDFSFWRLTVDYEDDYFLIKKIYQKMHSAGDEIMDLPSVIEIIKTLDSYDLRNQYRARNIALNEGKDGK